jgi:hypothetical protein
MKKYPERVPPNEPKVNDAVSSSSDLEFPVARDFLSTPPRVEFQAMLRRIEENMPWCSTRPGERERRCASKVSVEFVL